MARPAETCSCFQAKMYFYHVGAKSRGNMMLLLALMELLVFMFCWCWSSMENATFGSCFHFQSHFHLHVFWKSCFSKTYHGRCLHMEAVFTPSSFASIWQRMSSQWNPLQDLVRIAEQLHISFNGSTKNVNTNVSKFDSENHDLKYILTILDMASSYPPGN